MAMRAYWRKKIGPFELSWSRTGGFKVKLKLWG
jgi:hypothetical protein